MVVQCPMAPVGPIRGVSSEIGKLGPEVISKIFGSKLPQWIIFISPGSGVRCTSYTINLISRGDNLVSNEYM